MRHLTTPLTKSKFFSPLNGPVSMHCVVCLEIENLELKIEVLTYKF